MAKPTIVPPAFMEKHFSCPNPECGVYATHAFYRYSWALHQPDENVYRSVCSCCGFIMVWVKGKIVDPPNFSDAPEINEEFPGEIMAVIEEARSVYPLSPRASLGLLRLGLEMICLDRGLKKERLKSMLQKLIEKESLPARIVIALTLIKVYGDDAVHEAQIIETDNMEKAENCL